MARSRKFNFLTYKMKKKLILMFLVFIFAFIGLIGRLMYIEEVSGDTYERIVLSQQAYDSATIAYRRGDITDSRGTVLATSVDVYNLVLDASVINARDTYAEPTIEALMACYGDALSEADIRAILKDKPNSKYNVLIRQMPYEDMRRLYDLMNDGEHKNVKGLWFEKGYIRVYPYNNLASSIIGFTKSDGSGMNGLESYYDEALSGVNGRTYGYLNSDSDYERTTKPALDGATVVSTIDVNLQSIVTNKIKEYLETFDGNFDPDRGAAENIGVIMMDPHTGAVLSMADYPDYDLSNPRDLSAFFSEEEIAEMDDQQMYEALNHIWNNYCITSTYEPGSTAKPFTVACGLDTGVLTGNEVYVCDGGEDIAEYHIRCINIYGHGEETVKDALMDSCNDALMQMSYAIGTDHFTDYQSVFGFGLRTNIDLPGEARTDSLLHTKENMSKIDLATNSFGQNFNVTMIQLASAFSSIINGGYIYQPYVVSDVISANGQSLMHREPEVLKQTIAKTTSDRMKEYLYGVVSEGGTGHYAKVAGYSMGGKTGTAQMVPRDGVNYLVSFVGYAPAEDPQVLIYVVVDRPNTNDQAHSTYAQNIAREILEEALPYLNIYPDEEIAEDAQTEEMTNMLTGLSWYSDHALAVQQEYAGRRIVPVRRDPETTEDGEEGTAGTEEGQETDPQTGEPIASEEDGAPQTEDGDAGTAQSEDSQDDETETQGDVEGVIDVPLTIETEGQEEEP